MKQDFLIVDYVPKGYFRTFLTQDSCYGRKFMCKRLSVVHVHYTDHYSIFFAGSERRFSLVPVCCLLVGVGDAEDRGLVQGFPNDLQSYGEFL